MTMNAPINPGHMIPNSMEVYFAAKWSDNLMHLGFYKDPELASAGETSEDVYANGTLKKTKDWNKITVTFTAHELTVEKLAILQSWLVEVHAWTVTAEVERTNAWDWSYEKDILLKYSSADGSAITPTSVTALINGTETALTADTDYSVWVTSMWATYIKLLTGETGGVLDANAPANVRITVTYSVTNANAKVMDHKANSLAKPFVMVLVNEFEYDGEKKTIKTYVENCLADKAMLQQIADSDNTTVGFPLTITGTIKSQEFVGFSETASASSAAANNGD